MNEMITTILNDFAEWIKTQPVYIGGKAGDKEVLVLRDGEMESAVEVYLDENKYRIDANIPFTSQSCPSCGNSVWGYENGKIVCAVCGNTMVDMEGNKNDR